jgi:hypothetical protein
MNIRTLKSFALLLGVSLGVSSFAAGSSIQQQETAGGTLVLSNLGGDDEVNQSNSTQDASADAGQIPTPRSNVAPQAMGTLGSTPAVAKTAGPLSETADDSASRSAKYRDTMVNLPLLPNGRPANPAIQRRYLMVKKGDYVGGN